MYSVLNVFCSFAAAAAVVAVVVVVFVDVTLRVSVASDEAE